MSAGVHPQLFCFSSVVLEVVMSVMSICDEGDYVQVCKGTRSQNCSLGGPTQQKNQFLTNRPQSDVHNPPYEVFVQSFVLQFFFPEKCMLGGTESTQSASRLLQVRQSSLEEEDDGVVHPDARAEMQNTRTSWTSSP